MSDDLSNTSSSESDYTDYYDLLDVPRDADMDTINKSAKEKLRKYHPDTIESDQVVRKTLYQELYKDINKAKNVLTDREQREAYDRLGHEQYVSRRENQGKVKIRNNNNNSRSAVQIPASPNHSEKKQSVNKVDKTESQQKVTSHTSISNDAYGTVNGLDIDQSTSFQSLYRRLWIYRFTILGVIIGIPITIDKFTSYSSLSIFTAGSGVNSTLLFTGMVVTVFTIVSTGYIDTKRRENSRPDIDMDINHTVSLTPAVMVYTSFIAILIGVFISDVHPLEVLSSTVSNGWDGLNNGIIADGGNIGMLINSLYIGTISIGMFAGSILLFQEITKTAWKHYHQREENQKDKTLPPFMLEGVLSIPLYILVVGLYSAIRETPRLTTGFVTLPVDFTNIPLLQSLFHIHDGSITIITAAVVALFMILIFDFGHRVTA